MGHAQYVSQFMVCNKTFGPAQNILGPVEGQGIRKHFLVPLQNHRWSKQLINEIIGILTLADAKAICIYYHLPNPKLNSEQHRQNLNMRFADFFEFVGTNIVLIFDDSSSVETTHYMSLYFTNISVVQLCSWLASIIENSKFMPWHTC